MASAERSIGKLGKPSLAHVIPLHGNMQKVASISAGHEVRRSQKGGG
jgi:hypothetical protein